jgi:hypothetical protein
MINRIHRRRMIFELSVKSEWYPYFAFFADLHQLVLYYWLKLDRSWSKCYHWNHIWVLWIDSNRSEVWDSVGQDGCIYPYLCELFWKLELYWCPAGCYCRASCQYDFRDLKKLLSRGFSSWLLCAGRQYNWVPKSLATSSTNMSKCLRCPSKATSFLSWQPMTIEKFSAPTELFPLFYVIPKLLPLSRSSLNYSFPHLL